MFFGRKGLILGRAENSVRIAGKRLCDDARLRAFAAAGGLKREPGHRENRGQEVVRRRPFTGVCRRRRSSARHSCRVSVDQRHGARPVHGPSRWDKTGSAGVPPAMTNAGKMPALQRGIGQNAVRESGSAGVPPATTNAGKMPALHKGIGQNAVRESGSAGVPPAIHQRTEKPRQRGLRFARGSTPRPGVKRRASRPPAAGKARQRAFMLRRR